MRLWLSITIVSLVTLLQNTVPQQDTKATHAEHHSNNAAKDSKPGPQIVYVQAPSPDKDGCTQTKATTREQASPNWWQRPTVTDWILSVLTLAYLGVNIFMLIAIKRQAHLAEKSVNALMSAEQSILIIDKSEWDFDDVSVRNFFSWSLANSGKTAATVFAGNGVLQIGETADLPPDVSVYDYQPAHDRIEIVVSPGAERHPMWDLPLMPTANMTETERKGVLDGTRYLWAYGFYRYRDVFGRPFTQRFCYRWNSDNRRFYATGPWEYRRLI